MKSFNEWQDDRLLIAANATVKLDNENRLWIITQNGKTYDIALTQEQVFDSFKRHNQDTLGALRSLKKKSSEFKPPENPTI
jgi:hypothetical protein